MTDRDINIAPSLPAGVPLAAWQAIGAEPDGDGWKIPERDADGVIVGWSRRFADGAKGFVSGGHRGLTYAAPFPVYGGTSAADPVVVVEGQSDTAAGHGVGLCVVGRPSATGGGDALEVLLKDRHVVFVAENDGKDGKPGPGTLGAERLADRLARVCASVRIIHPPGKVKDLRAWIIAGGNRDDVLAEAKAAPALTAKRDDGAIGPVLINLGDVKPEPVDWLWQGRIPRGMISLIAGDPGLGKSTLTCSLAATVTRGGPWPDGTHAPAGGVLWLSAEDDPSRTLVPRLDAHNAIRNKIELMDGVRRVTGGGISGVCLGDDLPSIERAIEKVGDCKLIVVDPISAYLGKVDANSNSEVRGILSPLKSLAERTGAAVVLVQHLNKTGGASALYRMSGSIGFVGAARAGYIVARDPDDENRRLLLCAKMNIAREPQGIAFRIEGDPPRLVWDANPVTLTAGEALARASGIDTGDGGALEEATDFLLACLSGGPKASGRVQEEADAAGIRVATLRRAKKKLGVEAHRESFSGGWAWRLPDPSNAPKVLKIAQDAHSQGMSALGENERLGSPNPNLPDW